MIEFTWCKLDLIEAFNELCGSQSQCVLFIHEKLDWLIYEEQICYHNKVGLVANETHLNFQVDNRYL